MRTIALLFGALLAGLCPRAAEQDVITQSFTVKPGEKLLMRVDRGNINISTGTADTVDIRVVRELKRASDSRARAVYQEHKIDMDQQDGAVRVLAENKNTRRGWFGSDPFNHLHVDYTITVPTEFDLELRTAGGNISVSELQGEIKAHTSGGNMTFGSVTGPISARTSGGNITLKGTTGNADLSTSGGDLRIGEVEGDLKARTSGGNITLELVHGAVDAQTSGGDIIVRGAGGPVQARTSGGNVTARLNEQPAGECALRTSGGNVAVTLNEKIAVDLNARTSGGRVSSDFPGEFNKSRTSLAAKINGGGPVLRLETSGGNVDVRRK